MPGTVEELCDGAPLCLRSAISHACYVANYQSYVDFFNRCVSTEDNPFDYITEYNDRILESQDEAIEKLRVVSARFEAEQAG